jgi:hypothetical protein
MAEREVIVDASHLLADNTADALKSDRRRIARAPSAAEADVRSRHVAGPSAWCRSRCAAAAGSFDERPADISHGLNHLVGVLQYSRRLERSAPDGSRLGQGASTEGLHACPVSTQRLGPARRQSQAVGVFVPAESYVSEPHPPLWAGWEKPSDRQRARPGIATRREQPVVPQKTVKSSTLASASNMSCSTWR